MLQQTCLSPEHWREARQIFEDALDQEPATRDAFVREACQGDEKLFAEVATLLASYDQADDIFLNPVIEGVRTVDRLEGRQLGPYRILHRLGQGGMGAVYLAERADDQFRRRVAVKLVRPGYDDGHLLRRFRNERQLLAVLDHPNIVKLLDAGVTTDGIPYFVMDYVEGQPIDKYCETRGLSIPERLALFREVCAAVHCAHRNLVVHRDLKPSNILVTPEGAPKLLDFGIAKLLRPEYGTGAIGLTRTMQPMTPEFASPEQVTGQPITTSSDVYSLGVLLYRLIAGKHPYEMNTNSAVEVERAICQTIPERPSVVARSDTGRKRATATSDLDNIVLMAMRKEPQRRYASAEHLSEDIRRYLANLPVTARKDTVRYRATKFTSRHRVGVAAAVLTTIALIAVAAYAGLESGRAKARLDALRHSEHFMLFDLDNQLRKSLLDGRKALVREATGQIETIAQEAGDDQVLLQDVANGYHKIGDIQGLPGSPNLNQIPEARASYEKSLEVGSAMKPGPNANLIIGNAHAGVGRLDLQLGDRPAAEKHFQLAMSRYEAAGDLIEARHGLMVVWELLGKLEEKKGNYAEAANWYTKSVDRARELDRLETSTIRQGDVQTESLLLGLALARLGRLEESVKAMSDSLVFAQRIAATDPSMAGIEASAYGYLAYALALAGHNDEAVDAYAKSIGVFERITKKDPRDQNALIGLGQMKGEIAGVLWTAKRNGEATKATAEALEILKPVVDQEHASAYILQQYAEFLLAPSNLHPDPSAALKYVLRADTREHHSNPATLETLASAYAATGDSVRARETAQKGLDSMPVGGEVDVRKKLEEMLSSRAKSSPH